MSPNAYVVFIGRRESVTASGAPCSPRQLSARGARRVFTVRSVQSGSPSPEHLALLGGPPWDLLGGRGLQRCLYLCTFTPGINTK